METMTNDTAVNYITKVNGKAWAVDEENKRISFLDSRFYKAGPDLYVPSVTTILEAYPKGAAYAEWLKRNGVDADELRDEAGRRGSVVHEMTETLDKGGALSLMGEKGEPQYKLMEWAMLERYVDFRTRHAGQIHAIEMNLVSAQLGFAGTLDRIITIDGVTYLMDIKTGGAIHNSFWLQQAAYAKLLTHTGAIASLFPDGEVPEIKLSLLWLNAKTRGYGKNGAIQGPGWQFLTQEKPTTDLLRLFNCVRATWLEENATAAPKLTTYQLEHQLNQK